MSEIMCRLCLTSPAIQGSHAIPAFVFRAIKSDSATGFFRNPNNPNHRLQDGDKFPLLCRDCEQLFSAAEGEFASRVFLPFHGLDRNEFSYGPWLHYFMTSIAWRALTLDLSGMDADPENPRDAVAALANAAETMRLYLLGAKNLAGLIRNHAIVWTVTDAATSGLAGARPNWMIRRSAFGFSILDQGRGHSAILHNLAGFMCFMIVKGNPRDVWRGTKVNPAGGRISQPQNVSSWLIYSLLNFITQNAQKLAQISDSQDKKVYDAVSKNPATPSRRFHDLDKRLTTFD